MARKKNLWKIELSPDDLGTLRYALMMAEDEAQSKLLFFESMGKYKTEEAKAFKKEIPYKRKLHKDIKRIAADVEAQTMAIVHGKKD